MVRSWAIFNPDLQPRDPVHLIRGPEEEVQSEDGGGVLLDRGLRQGRGHGRNVPAAARPGQAEARQGRQDERPGAAAGHLEEQGAPRSVQRFGGETVADRADGSVDVRDVRENCEVRFRTVVETVTQEVGLTSVQLRVAL